MRYYGSTMGPLFVGFEDYAAKVTKMSKLRKYMYDLHRLWKEFNLQRSKKKNIYKYINT